MTPTVTVGPIEKTCPYCEKKGLPILPLRYAVARADMGNAPKLPSPFGAGVTNIALPGKQAHYTLRLLRPGYLYVYDERYGERGWSAYQIGEGGYLYPFDPYAQPPSGGWKQMHFSCSRTADQSVARCITVDDAAHAKHIWLGFSDVLWTNDVLGKHTSAAYRDAHMRCIDVALVRKGTDQPHASKLTSLGSKIAEYAACPADLVAETTPYVKKFLPSPFTDIRQMLASTAEGEFARQLSSGLILDLMPGALGSTLQTIGAIASAAWAFSASHLFADAALAESTEQWATEQAGPFHAGMVALDDAPGIAMELNGLIQQRTAEFAEDPLRKWKHETALTIQMFEHAVKNGVVEEDDRHGNSAIYAPTKEAADKIMEQVQEESWQKYAKLTSSADSPSRIIAAYQSDWKAYENTHELNALDVSYLAWATAVKFKRYFTHNYDRTSLPCGAVFTEVVSAVVGGLGARVAIVKHLTDALAADPTQHESIFVRALAMNHEDLIKGWVEGAKEEHRGDINDTLLESVATTFDSWSALMSHDPAHYRGIVKYVYNVSTVVLDKLGTASAKGIMAITPQKRLMILMGTLLKLEDPNLALVSMRGIPTEAQRANILNRAIARTLGSNTGQYKSAALRIINTEKVTMEALVIVNEGHLLSAQSAKGGRTLGSAAIAGAVSVETLDAAIVRTAPRMGAIGGEMAGGVVGMILTILTCKSAVATMRTAKGAELDRAAANLMSQVTGLTGTSFEAVATVLERYSAMRMGSGFAARSASLASQVEWLSGAGKILGGMGGMIGGMVGVWQGHDELQDGHKALGYADIVAGVLGFAAGAALLAAWIVTGVVAGVVAALILLLIAYFKQNPVQNWIEKSKLGDGELPQYKGLVSQQMALTTLQGG